MLSPLVHLSIFFSQTSKAVPSNTRFYYPYFPCDIHFSWLLFDIYLYTPFLIRLFDYLLQPCRLNLKLDSSRPSL